MIFRAAQSHMGGLLGRASGERSGRASPACSCMGRAGTCRRFAPAGWSSADAHRPKPEPASSHASSTGGDTGTTAPNCPHTYPGRKRDHMVQITLGPGRRHPGTGNADAGRTHRPTAAPADTHLRAPAPPSGRSAWSPRNATSRVCPGLIGPYPANLTATGLQHRDRNQRAHHRAGHQPTNASALATSNGASIPRPRPATTPTPPAPPPRTGTR